MAPLTLVADNDAAAEDAEDALLVAAIRAGDRKAAAAFYARHVERVRRILARIVGVSPELDDLVQDAFLTALRRLHALRDPRAAPAWLASVAVGCARHHLRGKARKRWLSFRAPEAMPEVPVAAAVDGSSRDAARAAAAVLASLPVDLRIAFSLRRVDGLTLEEAASMCGVSLATFKRRMQKADALFTDGARAHPALAELVR